MHSSTSSGLRPRQRTYTSCTECRRRKQKCNQAKDRPCNNCSRRYPPVVCSYDEGFSPPAPGIDWRVDFQRSLTQQTQQAPIVNQQGMTHVQTSAQRAMSIPAYTPRNLNFYNTTREYYPASLPLLTTDPAPDYGTSSDRVQSSSRMSVSNADYHPHAAQYYQDNSVSCSTAGQAQGFYYTDPAPMSGGWISTDVSAALEGIGDNNHCFAPGPDPEEIRLQFSKR